MKIKFSITILSILFSFFLLDLNAQNIPISNGTLNLCEGTLTDSGGELGNYGDNENFTTTICSDDPINTHIQLTFNPMTIDADDLLCFYDGDDTNAPLIKCSDIIPNNEIFIIQSTATNPNGCLTVNFTSNGTGNNFGWDAEISCIKQCQTVISEIAFSNPPVVPTDTGWIDVCLGDVLEFNGAGFYPQNNFIYQQADSSSIFEWDFGDGTISNLQNVTHIYTEAGGYFVNLNITDINGCSNTNLIKQRVRVIAPPNIEVLNALPTEICVEDTISLSAASNASNNEDLNISNYEGSFQIPKSVSDSICIPDNQVEIYSSQIEYNEFSSGQTLDDINNLIGICVDIEHSYLGDLEIWITCPSGQSVTLQNYVGFIDNVLGNPIDTEEACLGILGNGGEYCWTPGATNGTLTQTANTLAIGASVPEGNYSSFGSLQNLLGCPLNGEWTISIKDHLQSDDGAIFSWTLVLEENIYPNFESIETEIVDISWQANNSIFSNSGGFISASPSIVGEEIYTFTAMDNFGCQTDTSFTINVETPISPNCFECSGSLVPVDPILLENDSVEIPAPEFENLDFSTVTYSLNNINNLNFDNNNPLTASIEVFDLPYTTIDASSIESVCLDIIHSNLADVEIFLEAPDGTLLELSTNNGGNNFNYTNTCFSPNAIELITNGNAPFSGDFLPEESFDSLFTIQANGKWSLIILDSNPLNEDGELIDWNITFNVEPYRDAVYTWTPNQTLSCSNCPNPIAFPDVNTIYTVEITDLMGCTYTQDIEVIVCDINIDIDTIVGENCYGDNSAYFELEATSSFTGDYEYNLIGNSSQTNNGNFNNLTAGTYSLEISIGNCIDTFDIEINSPEELITQVDYSPNICYGTNDGFINVNIVGGTAPYTFNWSTNDTTLNITNLSQGVYEITITDANNCEVIESYSINHYTNQPISFTYESTDVTCNGDRDGNILIEAIGGTYPYEYFINGLSNSNSNYFNGLFAGYYDVSVVDFNGCTYAIDSIYIDEPDSLMMNIVPDSSSITLDLTDSVELSIEYYNNVGDIEIEWEGLYGNNISCDTCVATWVYDFEINQYHVMITDENGCTAEDYIDIVVDRDRTVFVPSAFTPNGDMMNDVLMVHGTTTTKVLAFKVFDRWGELLFLAENYDINSTDINHVWNGTFNGNTLNPGVFVWYVEVEYIDGRRESFQGNTTLIR